ncbi:MAG: MetQ/NlpA family ABC transporter substrate-binding protein [Anaerolineales bacterium]|jgi:NitT/TauT family transport system substrate-binding protein
MQKQRIYFILTILFLSFSLVLGACSQFTGSSEPVTLKMALLPILDTLPMYVAQQEGLFAENGVTVEFIPVGSAAERDQVVSAGQADGMINELVSTMFYNKEDIQVQIVRYARTATADTAMFRILAAGNSGINSVEQLKGTPIGISEGTVIEYLTDRLLQAQGFTDDEITTVAVPKIPDRMALLGSGELPAAMLPEPLSSLAMQGGAVLVLDDRSSPELAYSTIAFRKAVIDEHPQAISGFLAALEEAVTKINADPEKYNSLLSDQNLVPPSLVGEYKVPPFVTAGVPTERQWDDVYDWAKGKGLLEALVSYEESVTSKYLP